MLFILIILVLLLCACAFGYLTYRDASAKRLQEKRRNQYNDRI